MMFGKRNVEPAPGGNPATAAETDMAASEIERETSTVSVADVAERVYRIFCENLRRERERRGRWQ
ncbi:MAG: hypothetical protein HY782_27535 [Chloroflexi bacterium]|nr:hypothetical protein [Chloroflexota bacterium]